MEWDDVVAIGESLPGVSAGTWWGTPGLLVGKKGFCRLRKNPDALVIKVADLDDKEALLRGDPDTYFTTPHYEGSPHGFAWAAFISPVIAFFAAKHALLLAAAL